MTYNSWTVTAATDATADQYNNLRKDVLLQAGEYVTSGGSANAQTFTIDAQITAYVDGMSIPFKAWFTNTGAATGNVNGIGAKDIKLPDGSALGAGDITAGRLYELRYDGTNLVLMHTSGTLIATGVYNTTATNATFTADAGTDVVTSNAHGLQDGDKIVLTTTGTLPAGLSLTTGYYVRDVTTNTFKISSTPYRTAIDITDAGSGTHTWTFVRGSVKFTFAAKSYLKMYLRVLTPSVASALNIVLNQDANETNNNYGLARQTAGAGATNNDTFRWGNILGATDTANKYVDMSIENFATQRKVALWNSGGIAVAAGAATASNPTQWVAVWDNSSDQITEILVHLDGTASFDTNSIFNLYGSNSQPF